MVESTDLDPKLSEVNMLASVLYDDCEVTVGPYYVYRQQEPQDLG